MCGNTSCHFQRSLKRLKNLHWLFPTACTCSSWLSSDRTGHSSAALICCHIWWIQRFLLISWMYVYHLSPAHLMSLSYDCKLWDRSLISVCGVHWLAVLCRLSHRSVVTWVWAYTHTHTGSRNSGLMSFWVIGITSWCAESVIYSWTLATFTYPFWRVITVVYVTVGLFPGFEPNDFIQDVN